MKIKNPTQYAAGGDLGRIYPEREDDLTSLAGLQRHLKFGLVLIFFQVSFDKYPSTQSNLEKIPLKYFQCVSNTIISPVSDSVSGSDARQDAERKIHKTATT